MSAKNGVDDAVADTGSVSGEFTVESAAIESVINSTELAESIEPQKLATNFTEDNDGTSIHGQQDQDEWDEWDPRIFMYSNDSDDVRPHVNAVKLYVQSATQQVNETSDDSFEIENCHEIKGGNDGNSTLVDVRKYCDELDRSIEVANKQFDEDFTDIYGLFGGCSLTANGETNSGLPVLSEISDNQSTIIQDQIAISQIIEDAVKNVAGDNSDESVADSVGRSHCFDLIRRTNDLPFSIHGKTGETQDQTAGIAIESVNSGHTELPPTNSIDLNMISTPTADEASDNGSKGEMMSAKNGVDDAIAKTDNVSCVSGEFTVESAINDIGLIDSNNKSSSTSTNNAAFGSFGRSLEFDPFLRTRNVPFRIAGRRRSISVFNTIPEMSDVDTPEH
ncbi:uncharacterized protein LOC116351535 [Contarinia nasturtii]|uniref:uncharacterized protein LOC116351535 n=1 Tax=Contarinia nasturtii TaxID=265458 RepID=UPI0012D3F5D8|nr:uncharacterized protein LOC116351535 [Contarinia nasturtii]